MEKNIAGQKWVVYAFNAGTNLPVTGDASNITAEISKDGSAGVTLGDVNPVELGVGYYVFDLTQAETDANMILILSKSSTGSIVVKGISESVDTDPANFNSLNITNGVANADIIAIDGDVSSAGNLKNTYNGVGYTDDNGPAKQIQLDQITNSGSAVNASSNDDSTLTTGSTIAGDYQNTEALDGQYWQIADDAGAIDMYFEFSIGGLGVPSSITHTGRANGNTDDLNIYAWNWLTAEWTQIGVLVGKSLSSDEVNSYNLFTSHVGTGSNIGLVRIRYANTGLSGADFYTDQIFVSYSNSNQSVGYLDGAIWVDTVNGNPGTTNYVNGTADNPVSSLADAFTLSASLNLKKFHPIQGSSLLFEESIENKEFDGIDYIIDLNSQVVSSVVITGATISGSAAKGSGTLLIRDSKLDIIDLPSLILVSNCLLSDAISLNTPGLFVFNRCVSVVAGTATPSIDVGADTEDIQLNIRNYSGGIELKNLGQDGIDNVSLEGDGQLILDSTCVGGTIAIRGNFALTRNDSDLVNVVDTPRYDMEKIQESVLETIYEGTEDLQDFFRFVRSFLIGESDGGETVTANFKDATGVIDRIAMTRDGNGNRSSVVLNPSDI